ATGSSGSPSARHATAVRRGAAHRTPNRPGMRAGTPRRPGPRRRRGRRTAAAPSSRPGRGSGRTAPRTTRRCPSPRSLSHPYQPRRAGPVAPVPPAIAGGHGAYRGARLPLSSVPVPRLRRAAPLRSGAERPRHRCNRIGAAGFQLPERARPAPGRRTESSMDLQLKDRVAVVTGASKGIGLAVVRTLLDEGARVLAVSRSSGPELDGPAAGAGDRLVHAAEDLTDPLAPARAVARAIEVFGGLDVLVNNAGGPPPGVTLPRFGFLPLEDVDWAAMFEFNLFSSIRAARAAVPPVLAAGGGAIVNVSSGNAHRPMPMNVDYNAAKSALNSVSKALAEEFGPQGSRV